ncbi:MAG TPA: hypothetical protein VGF75_08285 [Candidatus Saccharimonadales bacterium]|jgi:hypothetical protein
MALTPTGNVSLKPRQGRSWKRARRIDIVSRLEAQFIPDADIARHLGLTVQALHHIKTSPEYLAKRTTLSAGVLSVYDRARLESEEAQKDELEDLIPDALYAVKTVLQDRTHPQYSRVAMDILDRNRHTSKISRTQHSLEKPPDTTEHDAKAAELLALLAPEERVPIVIEGNTNNALTNGVVNDSVGIGEETAEALLDLMAASEDEDGKRESY